MQVDKLLIDSFIKILNEGYKVNDDRTGVGTTKVFGEVYRIKVDEQAFPINKSKHIYFKGIVTELLWMMNGGDNIEYLKNHNVNYWDQWADENGDLGPIYGYQWRRGFRSVDDFGQGYAIDQLQLLIDTIKNNPNDRRQLVSAWNVGDLDKMRLPPCHYVFQTCVRGDHLDLMMHQRSCDMFLGVPFDIVLYSLLLCILARLTDKKPGDFIWTGGDCHIYDNHHQQVKKQIINFNQAKYRGSDILKREAKLNFNEHIDFSDLQSFLNTTLSEPGRVTLDNYQSMGTIPAEVAV